MSRLNRTIVAALLLSFPALPVFADVMDFKGTGLTGAVTLHASGTLADGQRVLVGQYLYGYQGNDYHAYCVDIDAWAGDSQATAVPLTGSSLNNRDLVGYLFETFARSVSTDTAAAGLGVAIWEVMYESVSNAPDPLAGEFSISGNAAVATAAAGYLATLPPSGSYTPDPLTTVLVSACKQDMLMDLGAPIPEPASLSVLALGAGLLLRRRRSRPARAAR